MRVSRDERSDGRGADELQISAVRTRRARVLLRCLGGRRDTACLVSPGGSLRGPPADPHRRDALAPSLHRSLRPPLLLLLKPTPTLVRPPPSSKRPYQPPSQPLPPPPNPLLHLPPTPLPPLHLLNNLGHRIRRHPTALPHHTPLLSPLPPPPLQRCRHLSPVREGAGEDRES